MNRNGVAHDIRNKFLGVNPGGYENPSMRIVLYSHDTMGIGHMRRNLLIASQLKRRFPFSSILVIAGAREAAVFSQNQNVDCMTLPSFQKTFDGAYRSRHLGIPAGEILDFRAQTILAAIKSYQPDLFIVDKIPQGAGGELLETLSWLSGCSNQCHTVLGLREILDEPETVISEWSESHAFDIIREYFSSIWVYGDRRVYDASLEYRFPADIASLVNFTGYLNTSSRLETTCARESAKLSGFVLCTVGGGQDGECLARIFVDAARLLGRPCKLLTGPYMPATVRQDLENHAKLIPGLEILGFEPEADCLIKTASHVISMGGYNTISAILSWNKNSMVVPRISPRREQLIRANRLADLGYLSVLHPDQLTAERLVEWVNQSGTRSVTPGLSIDFDGLDRICELAGAHIPTPNLSNGSSK